jgi:hypothetical protein
MAGKQKGGSYEREICKRLSLWWTQDLEEPRDDIFWRTSQSGGRATTRSKKGKKTCNSAGDICAIDNIGQPFLDVFVLEVKRGYSKNTLMDLLDKSSSSATQIYEKWILQAEESKKQSGSLSWLIIAKRDKRVPIVILPNQTFMGLMIPLFTMTVEVAGVIKHINAITLDSFLDNTKPSEIRRRVKS